MFVVGHTYENRRGRYLVRAVRAGKLLVKYEDGQKALLNEDIQKNIIKNMSRQRRAEKDNAQRSQGKETVGPARPAVNWARYDLWNRKIFDRYFGEASSEKLVYLDLDEQEVGKIAPDDQAAVAPMKDFVRAIGVTLDVRGARLLDNHLNRLQDWKRGRLTAPPPFVALLALFCLAAQSMRSDEQYQTNNYYDRLSQILLGDGYSEAKRNAVQSGFRKAQAFWAELEGWLRKNHGRHGLPSAQPMYRLRHVGLPISQALLRSNDREKLTLFFAEEGLDNEEGLPPVDMERIMHPWVPVSTLSSAARASWSDKAARRRMAEVASLELSNWDGSLPSPVSDEHYVPTRPIALEAQIFSGPRPRLDLGVVLPMPPKASSASYEFDSNQRDLPAWIRGDQEVVVTRGFGDHWSEPIPDFPIADFLINPLELQTKGGSFRCRWQPRQLLVLSWDDELKTYRSQRRLVLGRRCIVLAFKTISSAVLELLTQYDGGNMSRIPSTWGVPEGWVALKDVQLRTIPEIGCNDDLAALQPDVQTSIEWNGGISLPGRRRWVSTRLPRVTVSAEEEVKKLTLSLRCIVPIDHTDEPRDIAQSEFCDDGATLDLSELEMKDGVYGLTISVIRTGGARDGEILSRETFEVRSSENPLFEGPEFLSHLSGRRQWALSAVETPYTPSLNAVSAAGALVRPEHVLSHNHVSLPPELGPMGLAEAEEYNWTKPRATADSERSNGVF